MKFPIKNIHPFVAFVSFVVSRNQRDGHKENVCALELPPITVDLV